MSIVKSQFSPPATESQSARRRPGSRGAIPFASVLSHESTPKMATDQIASQSEASSQAITSKKRAQALVSLAQVLEGSGNALENAQSALSVRKLLTLVGNFEINPPASNTKQAQKANANSAAAQTQQGAVAQQAASVQQEQPTAREDGLGSLAAQFESGSAGSAAIGYDRVGGTSYGKYQIASRVGSMNNFLKFLDKEAPDLADRLRSAGPANTGGRRGKMPDTWRAIAAEQPTRFEALQEKFIHASHYAPALDALTKSAGINPEELSPAMQEVLWSTAVQHGPAGAARIFNRAVSRTGKLEDSQAERKIIDSVYAIRAEQFGSSTEQVRAAVRNRLKQEKAMALAMLKQGAIA